ncbi:MAG: hypothetical protein K6U12_08975 [Armatimonadetes bacterium]|nr:hypothetical protein [Armatimonadota bacterium]CUU37880.1 hypothetical protein DCOP10_1237 [Armatimonadetes bacterium DC]
MEAITQIFLVMMVWAVAAAWIFALVNMAITGDVHPGEALAGSLIALLLAFASARQAFPHAVWVSLLTLGGSAIGLPLLRAYLNRHAHAQMDAELAERACLAVEYDPKNFGALVQLANLCYQHDLLELAVHYMRQAVQQAPMFTYNEKRTLSRWEDELQQIPKRGSFPCMVCGEENPIGPLRCQRCHHFLIPAYIQGGLLPKQLLHKIMHIWVVAVSAIVLSLLWLEHLMGLSALGAIGLTLLTALLLIFWILHRK